MPELTLLSYGAGQDSWALLLAYVFDEEFRKQYAPGRFVVAMSDTGAEHPHTYEHVEYTKQFCQRHGIEFHFITTDMGYHTGDWANGGLLGMYEAKSVIGSAAFPMSSCTASLKISPLYKWFNEWVAHQYGFEAGNNKEALKSFAAAYGKIRVLIGFAKGEEGRAGRATTLQEAFDFACDEKHSSDPQWMQIAIDKQFPLIDLGYDRDACQAYALAHNEIVPYPSACTACHWKSAYDILWTRLVYPEHYLRWRNAELQKLKAWADPEFRRQRQKHKFQPDEVFKNSPVSGKFNKDGSPILLDQRADEADRELEKMGLHSKEEKIAWLDYRRKHEGHGVKSKAA